MENKFEDVR